MCYKRVGILLKYVFLSFERVIFKTNIRSIVQNHNIFNMATSFIYLYSVLSIYIDWHKENPKKKSHVKGACVYLCVCMRIYVCVCLLFCVQSVYMGTIFFFRRLFFYAPNSIRYYWKWNCFFVMRKHQNEFYNGNLKMGSTIVMLNISLVQWKNKICFNESYGFTFRF